MNTPEAYGQVLEILFDHKEGYDGITIKTSREDIEIYIDNSTLCCEIWGIDIDKQDYKHIDIVGEIILNVKFNCVREKSMQQIPYSDEKHCACIDIQLETRILEIDVYCHHNGYYPHNIYTKWLNHTDLQVL